MNRLSPKTSLMVLALAMTVTSTGCVSRAQIDADLTKALAYEDQIQVTVSGLEAGISVMIQSLPAEQQAGYRDSLQQFHAAFTAITQAKDDAIIAAKEQNAERFDLLPFIARWVPIIEQFIALGETLRVQRSLLDTGHSLTIKLKAVR